MKKSIISALFIVLLATGGHFGFQQYRMQQVLHTLKPTVQLASAYLDEFYALEKNSADLTLAEYCEKADAAVNDLEKKLAELKNQTSQEHEVLYSMVVTHVETSRQSIREFSVLARLRLEHESAKEAADISVSKLHTPRNHRELRYARTSAEAAIKDLKEVRLRHEKSIALVYASAAEVKSQRHVLQDRFGAKSVVSKDGLDYVLDKFTGEPGRNSA